MDDTASGVNGLTGATGVLNVLVNDTLNGTVVTTSDVTLTETVAEPNGYLVLNTDGSVDVPPNTPAGTFQLTYQICQTLNPSNCDTAVASVTVDVPVIISEDDAASDVSPGATAVLNVFDNDTLNSATVDPADVTLTETVAEPNGYLVLNTDGSVDVPPNTPGSTTPYELTYQICENLNPTNCDTAVVLSLIHI